LGYCNSDNTVTINGKTYYDNTLLMKGEYYLKSVNDDDELDLPSLTNITTTGNSTHIHRLTGHIRLESMIISIINNVTTSFIT